MRQRKSLELYPLTMCYFIIRTQKCTKLFFNHYITVVQQILDLQEVVRFHVGQHQ